MSPTIVDLTASSPAATQLSEELPIKNVLIATITDAEPERLRATLQEICNSSPEAFRIAKNLLLVPEEQVKYKTIDRKIELTMMRIRTMKKKTKKIVASLVIVKTTPKIAMTRMEKMMGVKKRKKRMVPALSPMGLQ